MEAGSGKRRDSARPNTPGISGANITVKKKAPAPPAPGQQTRSPQVTQPKPSEVKDVKRPCAEHNFLTDVRSSHLHLPRLLLQTDMYCLLDVGRFSECPVDRCSGSVM